MCITAKWQKLKSVSLKNKVTQLKRYGNKLEQKDRNKENNLDDFPVKLATGQRLLQYLPSRQIIGIEISKAGE